MYRFVRNVELPQTSTLAQIVEYYLKNSEIGVDPIIVIERASDYIKESLLDQDAQDVHLGYFISGVSQLKVDEIKIVGHEGMLVLKSTANFYLMLKFMVNYIAGTVTVKYIGTILVHIDERGVENIHFANYNITGLKTTDYQ